ncbi:MAG: circadian clock protein KaiB [Thermodesulfobacteriota bacterium]
MYILTLYVVGKTGNSAKAIEQLRTLLEDNFKDLYSLVVIDLLENPQLAEENKIFATPTVIKSLPEPVKKVIGDLSNREKVLVGLDMVKK